MEDKLVCTSPKLKDLIAKYCPDGVEQLAIGDVFKVITPPKKLQRNTYSKKGKYAIIDQGQSAIVGFTDDSTAILPVKEYVLFGDHTRFVKYVDFPFAQGADGLKILLPVESIYLPKYLFYAFSNLDVPSRGYSRHWSIAHDLKIGVPPLPIQEEIVRILDTFTEMETELEAELEARILQYEHYRDNLLDFSSDIPRPLRLKHLLQTLCPDGVEYKKVKHLCKISNGRDHKLLAEGDFPVYGSGGIMRYADDYLYDEPSVLIPRKGSINNIFYVEEPFWVVDTIFYTKINDSLIIPKFLFYFLEAQQLEKLNTAGGIPSLTKSILDEILIPVPPLAIQEEIVAILNRFEALVGDLKDGLPAEITARRKQYEYYRNQLLTFPPLEAD